MKKIRIPGTAIETSRLGFGTASLHHLFSAADRLKFLGSVLDAGLTHFDTARMYGEGMAEATLGRFLAGSLRQQVTVATKFGLPADPLFERFPGLMYAQRAFGGVARRMGIGSKAGRLRALSAEAAESSLAKSMEALRTDWLDILLVHEPHAGEAEELHDLAEWLLRIKREGRVRCVGLAGNAAECVALVKEIRGVFDILQVEDSLAGREADVLMAEGRPLQVTYGYMRRSLDQQAVSGSTPLDGLAVIKAALARNENGMVLVSTRKVQRVRDMAALVDEEDTP